MSRTPSGMTSPGTFKRKEFRWLAVRCCCVPTKVFGFVRVELEIDDRARREKVMVRDTNQVEHSVRLMPMCKRQLFDEEGVEERELAIYSEDHPISSPS